MSKLLEKIIEVSNFYFSRFPTPESVKVFGTALQFGYTYTDPNTNSKKKAEMLFTPESPPKGFFANALPTLSYEEKPNRVEVSGKYGSYLAGEQHENLLQDQIFGTARQSKNGRRWVYVAKVKEEKTKSYFDGGTGANQQLLDIGERYIGTNRLGLFVLDTLKRTITKVPTEQGQIVSSPDFLNEEGSQLVYAGYCKQHFKYGLSHCFNRPSKLYSAELKEDKFEVAELPFTKSVTNLYPRVSDCGNYLLYFNGNGNTHVYYLNVTVLKKNSTTGEFEPHYELPEFFAGSYNECRSEFFEHEGKVYALIQRAENSRICLYVIDVEAKTVNPYTANAEGVNETILAFDPQTKLLVTKHSGHNSLTFGHSYLPRPLEFVAPINSEDDFVLESIDKPIPHFVLRSKNRTNIFGEPIEKSPLIVAIHGGPHGYADLSLGYFKYVLLKCGYTIIYPNFSGSVGYGKKFLEASLGKIGSLDSDEIVSCVQQLIANDATIDAKRVYLYGGSYGGYQAGILGSRYAQHFTAAVLLNPVLSLPFMYGTTDIPQWCTVEALNKPAIEDLSEQDYVQMYKVSPIGTPLKIPGLLIVGQKDKRVPHEAAKIYAALCRSKGVPTQLYMYPESDHRLADSVETSIDVVIKTLLFMEEHQNKTS